MAKLKIYKFPDKVLTQKAKPIEHIEKSLHQLAEDMLETMYDAPGVGLAANQVGILQRIVVIDTDYEVKEDIIVSRNPRIIINPEIVLCEGRILFQEGCLSVPEFTAEVKRSEKLKLRYQDLDGKTQELSAEGLLAVAIQHEIDHLDGKLFIDRLSPLKKEMVRRKLLKQRDELSEAKPSPKKVKGF